MLDVNVTLTPVCIPHDHGSSSPDTCSVYVKEQIIVPQLTRELKHNM